MLKKLWKDEEGQGMVEYGLIIALVAVVLIAVLTGLGGKIGGVFNTAGDKLDDASTAAPVPTT